MRNRRQKGWDIAQEKKSEEAFAVQHADWIIYAFIENIVDGFVSFWWLQTVMQSCDAKPLENCATPFIDWKIPKKSALLICIKCIRPLILIRIIRKSLFCFTFALKDPPDSFRFFHLHSPCMLIPFWYSGDNEHFMKINKFFPNVK